MKEIHHPRLALPAPAAAASVTDEPAPAPVDLPATAAALERFCDEFGIERDSRFRDRTANVAFTNGVALADIQAERAQRFLDLTAGLEEFPADVRARLVAGFAGSADWPSAWLNTLRDLLATAPDLGSPAVRLLALARLGVQVARELPDFVAAMRKAFQGGTHETLFLTFRLLRWRDNGFLPVHDPFLEYAEHFYDTRPIERRVICIEMAHVLAVARRSANPWELSLWILNGWERGRRIALQQPEDCRAMLEEAPASSLKFCQELYEGCVLGTATPDGAVCPERATRHFFAYANGGRLARTFTLNQEPRSIARAAFDFAFWMGIYSVHPLPARAAGAA